MTYTLGIYSGRFANVGYVAIGTSPALALNPAGGALTPLDLPTVDGFIKPSHPMNGPKPMPFKIFAAVVLANLALPAFAQQTGAPMPGMPMPAPAATDSPSTKAFKAADDTMMKEMDRPMTGNADQDFAAGMLPHHRGAVAMAKVELQYGKDPEMLKLAHGIIAAQNKEIAQMQAWQKKHPKP